MSVISADDIISIIKNEIENYDWDNEAKETGEVIWVGDGIATVYGIDHAMYGEIVVFDGGVKGMVQNIRRNEIGCILLATTNPFVKAARSSVQAREPAFPSVMPLKEELSTPWVNLSTAKVILLPLNIVPSRNRHRRSLIVSLLIHHWKQVSFPLTPCSQSAVVSVN